MFDLLKVVLFCCGCLAVYGLATGQDLNQLFQSAGDTVVPAAKAVVAGVWKFIAESIK